MILNDFNLTKLQMSTFNENSLTKRIVHGYGEAKFGVHDWMLRMKNELLIKDDYNVILLTWHHGNNFPHVQAAANARIVSAMVSLRTYENYLLNIFTGNKKWYYFPK